MTRSSLALARKAITTFFDHSQTQVFRKADLSGILRECRKAWKLSAAVKVDDFIEHLADSSHLSTHTFDFPSRAETIYSWRHPPLMHVLRELKPHAYFTHLTAAGLHGMAPLSKTDIYLNVEQRPHVRNPGSLTQSGIDNAFRNAPRVSNNVATYEGRRIVLLNGMNTASLGVESVTAKFEKSLITVRTTRMERTLIDLAVRPNYSGGVQNVLKCYYQAMGRVRVSDMASLVAKLDYVYPYHQCIGFYLEMSGYPERDVQHFRDMPMKFDFYLDHQIHNPRYVRQWRLNVPPELAMLGTNSGTNSRIREYSGAFSTDF